MRALLTALLVVALPATAAAQSGPRQPALVEIGSLFGEGTLISEGWAPVHVAVENLTRGDHHGTLLLTVSGFRGMVMRRELPLDVPAGQTRRVVLPVFTGPSGTSVTARYQVDGRTIAADERAVDYAPSERSVVVFADPPRLRGALLELDVDAQTSMGARQVRYPIGTVRFDPATSDPLLPEQGAAWSTVRLLVASAPALLRASAPQREAIEDWLRTGGELLIYPRSDADLRRPWIVELAGEIATDGAPPDRTNGWVPREGEAWPLRCAAGQRVTPVGCERRFGMGSVTVANHDGGSPAAIEDGAPRAYIRMRLLTHIEQRPALRFARDVDELDQTYWEGNGSFGTLRGALDPNQGFRPALILVALVFLIYVVLVGPLNFRWVGKRNRPTLALFTTPVVASGCVLVLLAVGYVGKGVTMRYRRVELVETVEGEARAMARRYTGLFSTRPGTFDLPADERGTLIRRIGGSGEGPSHRTEPGGERLVDFRAGLWETTLVREDRLLSLGGPITFERDELRLAGVRNDSQHALLGAVAVDSSGSVYLVGDVPAGTRADIGRVAAHTLSRHFMLGPDAGAPRTFTRATGGDPEDADERARVRGLIHLLGNQFVPDDAPVLYARLPASEDVIGGRFGAEVDQRWIRLQPELERPDRLPSQWAPPTPDPTVQPIVDEAQAAPDPASDPLAPAEGGAP